MTAKRMAAISIAVALLLLAASLFAGGQNEGAADKVAILHWVGGDWEVAGIFQTMTEIAAQYMKENPKVQVDLHNIAIDTYLAQYEAQGQAKAGPDLIYTWPGVYSMEPYWKGYIVPVDDYVPKSESKHYIGYDQSAVEGKHLRITYFQAGKVLFYNKTLMKKAGLDPMSFPKDWKGYLAAAAKFKAGGAIPLSVGFSDQWMGGCIVGWMGSQTMGSEKVLMEMAIGERKFTDKEFVEIWERMYDLYAPGYMNKDCGSVGFDEGIDYFRRGEAATSPCWAPIAVQLSEILGADNVGVATIPVFGKTPWAGKYTLEVHGPAITAWSKHKQVAANWAMYLHTPFAMETLHKKVGVIVADDRFNPAWITHPAQKQDYGLLQQGTAPWFENFYPTMIDFEGACAGAPLLFTGQLAGPKEIGQYVEDIAAKWRATDPKGVENWKKWKGSFK